MHESLMLCSVRLSLTADGRPNGTAFVEFASPMEAEAALVKDHQMLGSRYVELFPSTPEEVLSACLHADA